MEPNEFLQFRRRALAQLGALGGSLLTVGAAAASSNSPDDFGYEFDPWMRARTQLVLNSRLAYMDTAMFGPSSRAVLASEYRAREMLQSDPGVFFGERYSTQAVLGMCQRLGTWLDCGADEVCFTRGALAGLMQFGQALNLQAGDEVLINAQLPDALRRFWIQQARQRGLVLKIVALPVPLNNAEQVVAAFENAMTERSRVLVCSHIQQGDGAVLPIRELCELAKERNTITMIDGTLSFAALQFSVRELGCDVYGASLCHWLNGAQQTGVLYVRSEMQSALPDEYANVADVTLASARATWPRLQRRWIEDFIEQAPQFQTVPTALAWQEGIGRPRIEARLRELQTYARLRLQSIAGLELLTPVQPGMWLQILSARSARRNARELSDWLRNNDKVIVSHANATQDGANALRISLHVYNSHDEIERLTQGLQRALRV
jgi:selenocysteine lyase/cysteine desulfurase